MMINGQQLRAPVRISSPSLLRKAFLIAGLLFLAVCAVGFLTRLIVDQTGVISSQLQNTSRWDTSFFQIDDASARTMKIVFGIGTFAILASSICAMIWAFRFNVASRTFIAFNYVLFIVGQGIGFGALFMVFKAWELLGIFGIAGAIFLSMALIGMVIKDGTKLIPFIWMGMGISLVMAIVSIALYFAGIYSDILIMLMTVLTGVLTCVYTVFDVWWIRTSSQAHAAVNDKDMEFRMVAFFGFKLASDLIVLIWTIARLYLRTSRR